jgi:hypothetical protein
MGHECGSDTSRPAGLGVVEPQPTRGGSTTPVAHREWFDHPMAEKKNKKSRVLALGVTEPKPSKKNLEGLPMRVAEPPLWTTGGDSGTPKGQNASIFLFFIFFFYHEVATPYRSWGG